MLTDNASGGPDEGASQYQVLRVIMSQIAMVRDEQAEFDRKLSAQAATVEELLRGVSADMKSLLAREGEAPGRLPTSIGGGLSRRDVSSIPSAGSAEVAITPSLSNAASAGVSIRNAFIHNLSDIQTSPDLCRAASSGTRSFEIVPTKLPRVRVLKPDSFVRLFIDCCTIMALVFDAFSVPFVLAWDPPMRGFLKVAMFGTTAVWVLDMCANVVTGYYEDGVLITDLPTVVRHYLRHLFLFDFSFVVLDVVNIIFEVTELIGESITVVTLFRVFKIQRFVRFLAILRLGRMWNRVHDVKGMIEFSLAWSKLWMMLIEIVKFLLVILWLNHCLCCIFYAIGKVGGVDTGYSWLDKFDRESPTSFEYTTAFHYTLTQMTPGSMEVFASNSLERVFTIMWLLFGLLFGSSLVSYLSAHLVKVNQQNAERSKTQATLRRFLRQHGIQAVLAYRVELDIMNRAASPAPLLERELPCLSKLSGYLRSELWLALFTPHISPHPLFYTWHFIDPFTTRDICFACHFVYLPSGEELFEKGCRKTSAHILAHGKMEYSMKKTMCVTEGDKQITDGAWISEAAWWMYWTTRGCMETLTECKLVCLEASRLMEVLANHPHTEALILAYGQAFHKLASSMPRDQLSDLNFLDHGEVVSHMPREERRAVAEIVLGQQKFTTRRVSGTRGFGAAARTLNLAPADVVRLKSEVERGQCALVFGREGRPVRVVSIVVLHIVWPSRRWILAQLAKVKEGESTPRCQLPATKRDEDESPHDAAVRLLSRLRALLPDGYEEEFGEYEKIVVHHEKSASYANLPTRFTRNIFRLQIQEPDDSVDCPKSPRIHGIHSSHESEDVKLFSWLSLEDYDRFNTEVDTKDLANWISKRPLEEAHIEC